MYERISQLRWDDRLRGEWPFVFGVATLCMFLLYGSAWLADPTQLLERGVLFVWLLATIVLCIFGVARHADALADILGEPFGTLILTISVIVIEVSLIAAVMFEGVTDPTLARDTMFSVIMIMMNGMVGLCLLSGGLVHVQQEYNLEGARAYLAVLIPLSAIALILPRATSSAAVEGTLSPWQATLFTIATLVLYAIFLALQTMRHRGFFALQNEDGGASREREATEPQSAARHAVLLLLTMLPIVGLAEYLAVMVEQGIHAFHIPTPLGGMLIAALILAPESIAALRAALANNLQRSINLCLGSALSTVALTVPLVLMIGLATGQSITLGLDDEYVILLVLTLMVSMLTFSGARTNVLQGAVHLLLLFTYIVLIFDP
ncbi:MAG: calcium:proton antiporter [Hyphomicrobium sp.]|jgi:Ca2+:H+ antiporter